VRRLAPLVATVAATAVLGGSPVAPVRAAAPAPPAERIGRSVQGRPIGVVRVGDPAAPRKVLVVGCIHGDECAGRAIAERLRRRGVTPAGTELLLVRNLNPDGLRRGTRQNARGVDLNRNSSEGWRFLGARGTRYHAGARPFSEPESRAIRRLILAERPSATIWYHQPLALVVRPETGRDALARAYARLSGLPARSLGTIPGGLSRWQNARVRAGSSIVVELAAGRLTDAHARRHAGAVLAVAGSPGALTG
jgi:murein peptide amidase A